MFGITSLVRLSQVFACQALDLNIPGWENIFLHACYYLQTKLCNMFYDNEYQKRMMMRYLPFTVNAGGGCEGRE